MDTMNSVEDVALKYDKIEKILFVLYCAQEEFYDTTPEDFDNLRDQFVLFFKKHKRDGTEECIKFMLGENQTFNLLIVYRDQDFHLQSKNNLCIGTSAVASLLTNLLVPKNSNHVKIIVKILNSAGVFNVLLHETSVQSRYKRATRVLNVVLLFLCTKKLQAENIFTQLLDLNNILSNVTPILRKDNVTKQEVEEILDTLENEAKKFDSIEWNWFTEKEVGFIKTLNSWVLHEDAEKNILMDHLLMIDRVGNNTIKHIKFLDNLISLFKNVLIHAGTQYGGLTADLNVTTKFKEAYLFYIKIWGVPSDGMFDDLKIDVIETEFDAFTITYDTFDFDKFQEIVLDTYRIRTM